MNKVRAFVFGGQYGMFSQGMRGLTTTLNGIKGITASYHSWNDYNAVSRGLPERVAVIGFSLGGNTAAELSRRLAKDVDLVVAYDPSRQSPTAVNGIEKIPTSIPKAVCYWNPNAWYYGGAKFAIAPNASNFQINEWHFNVASRQDLHLKTVGYIRDLQEQKP